jgi:hypothetical protein
MITSPLAERLDSAGISLYTLQLRNQIFAVRSVSIVESAADSILQLTSDKEVKKNALTWKIHTVPRFRGILLFSDPLLAQFESWFFCGQVLAYFETGRGKENFGSLQPIALHASRRLFSEAAEMMRSSLSESDFRRLDSLISNRVRKFPIQNDIFMRESAVVELSALLGDRDYSVQSAVGRMARDTEDIAGSIPIYTSQLPREVRWQAEYLLAEHDFEGRLDSIQGQIVEITAAINEITEHLEKGDLEVNVGTIRGLQEYLNTLEKLVGRGRVVVMEEVDRIRLETMAKVEAYADSKVQEVASEVYSVVDYVLLRMVILMGVAVIAIIGTILFVRRKGGRPAS